MTIYNKSLVRVDKASIPLERQKGDFFITNLFADKWGTIRLRDCDDIFIVKFGNKKYYLVPPLFESEVLI